MADAYSVMALAKRQGAEVSARKEYDDYMKKVQAEEARASKAGMFGNLGGGILGSIASFLSPAILTALNVGTHGIGGMLLSSLIGTGVSRGGTELGDVLARQWTGAGGKKMKDVGKYKDISGPYGRQYASKLKKQGKDIYGQWSRDISQMQDVQNINRWLTSGMSGLGGAGKARSAAETLKLAEGGLEAASIGEKMMAGLKGKVGEGWEFGAGETGAWWDELLNPTKLADTGALRKQGLEMLSKGLKSGERSAFFGADYPYIGTSDTTSAGLADANEIMRSLWEKRAKLTGKGEGIGGETLGELLSDKRGAEFFKEKALWPKQGLKTGIGGETLAELLYQGDIADPQIRSIIDTLRLLGGFGTRGKVSRYDKYLKSQGGK